MSFLIGFLTVILVLDCLFLILLVLVQLPKKEAGAGLAFGGGASDALFGAGSGTALTKITKYTAGIFFGLALLLSMLNTYANKSGPTALEKELSKEPATSLLPAGSTIPPGSTIQTTAGTPASIVVAASNSPSLAPTNTPFLLTPASTNQ